MRHLELRPKDLLKVNRTKDEKKKRTNKLSKRQLKQVSRSRTIYPRQNSETLGKEQFENIKIQDNACQTTVQSTYLGTTKAKWRIRLEQ